MRFVNLDKEKPEYPYRAMYEMANGAQLHVKGHALVITFNFTDDHENVDFRQAACFHPDEVDDLITALKHYRDNKGA